MGVEQGSFAVDKKKKGPVELFKLVDKFGTFGGVGVYLLFGIPAALTIAALSGVSWGATEGGERLYKKWKSKTKRK